MIIVIWLDDSEEKKDSQENFSKSKDEKKYIKENKPTGRFDQED